MANFRKPRHSWDVDSPQYKGRLKLQAKSRKENKVMYSSGYIETGKFLRNSHGLENIMYKHSRSILSGLRSRVGRDEGTGGYHLQDAFKMKKVRKGGWYKDRMAYHISVDGSTPAGNAFLMAEFRSQFSKEAWKTRQGYGGEPANKSVTRNRKGWIRGTLSDLGREEGLSGE